MRRFRDMPNYRHPEIIINSLSFCLVASLFSFSARGGGGGGGGEEGTIIKPTRMQIRRLALKNKLQSNHSRMQGNARECPAGQTISTIGSRWLKLSYFKFLAFSICPSVIYCRLCRNLAFSNYFSFPWEFQRTFSTKVNTCLYSIPLYRDAWRMCDVHKLWTITLDHLV